MGALTDRIAPPTAPLRWLDDDAYVGRLLAGGATPWLDPIGYIATADTGRAFLIASAPGDRPTFRVTD